MSAKFASIQEAMASGETLVLAHRGAMASAPMNTLAAFELALEQGADGIELDVQRSGDGHAVIMHDFSVDATTDGSGPVAEKSLSELQDLDAGGWFSSDFTGEGIPSLDQVFASLGDRTLFNVEIKSGSDGSGNVEEQVAACVRRFSLQNRVVISSFDPTVLLNFRLLMPKVMIGFLYDPKLPSKYYIPLRKLSHEARHPRHDMVDEAYMRWARENDYYVNTWTVNELERAVELRRLGVNAIISDDPKMLVDALSS
ncbi:MAG: glycerophosphodiester phosphodiesterase family protein [Chloroflexota bacterium]|nr:glycerophosphodiester phosphodiesterase family protein [Chloroflexota bacterium]